MKLSRIGTPLVIVVAALALAVVMVRMRPVPETVQPEQKPLLVEVVEVAPRTLTIAVRVQGMVQPQRSISLISEVSGRVVESDQRFNAGGFFKAGELLLQLDDRDYAARLQQAQALVAQARSALAQEQGRGYVAKQEWSRRAGREALSPQARELALRTPQLQEAEAQLESARASLRQAQLDLEHTALRAPFDGLLTRKGVDVGQYIAAGASVGEFVSVAAAQVRLAVPESKLAYLELPDHYRGVDAAVAPVVHLHRALDGAVQTWQARLVRTEGVVDERSRALFVVAEVDDPYGLYAGAPSSQPPLRFGTFIDAQIEGRSVPGLIALPRAIIRPGNLVWVVDGEDRLQERQLELLRTDGADIFVRSGLAGGERVCLTSLGPVLPGTAVSVVSTVRQSDDAAAPAAAAAVGPDPAVAP